MVVLNHSFPSILPGGYAGVDVFFVISGFVITGSINDHAKNGILSIVSFYSRRVRRIFPALVTVLLFSMTFALYFLIPSDVAQLGKHIAAGAFFVPNLLLLSEVGYFDPAAEAKPLLHLWSLGVEEQFYFLWPAALLFMHRLRRAAILTCALMAVSLALFFIVGRYSDDAAFYLPFTRFWEILAGCALFLGKKRLVFLGWALNSFALAGLALLIFAGFVDQRQAQFGGMWPVCAVLGAGALILAGPGAAVNRVLAFKPLVGLGIVSYPLYLWHWPLLSFSHILNQGPVSWPVRCACVAASLVLAVLTYRFVESPIRSGGRRGSFKVSRSIGALAGALALSGLAGAALAATHGARFRFPEDVRKMLAFKDYEFESDARSPGCWLDAQAPFADFAPACFLGSKSPTRRSIVLWGDSHAARLYPGLNQVLGRNSDIAQLTRDGCPALLGFGYELCKEGNRRVLEYVMRSAPSEVILFSVWPQYPPVDASGKTLEQSLEQTIDSLHASGIRNVILVGPYPNWNSPLPDILFNHWTLTRNLPLRMVRTDDGRVEKSEASLRRVAGGAGVTYLSIVDLLCNSEGCLTSVPGSQGELLTWDYGHLTTAGAKYVADSFFRSK